MSSSCFLLVSDKRRYHRLLWCCTPNYVKEHCFVNNIPWNPFLSVYPEKNVKIYRNHPRRDLFQIWKWLSLGKDVWDNWNLSHIFQQEVKFLMDSDRISTFKDCSVDEAWTQLSQEWTCLGFQLSNPISFIRTAACLWIYLKEGTQLGSEERSEISRVVVLLQLCCSEPKQVLRREDVLSRLSSCALLLLALISFHQVEDIIEYYGFLVSYCKKHFRLDCICLLSENETEQFLQTYLDETGDIQSVALLSLHFMLLSQTSVRMSWIYEYRRILEQLSQWELLAELNIFCTWNMMNYSSNQSSPQATTSHPLDAICYFCNKSLLHVPFRMSKDNNSISSFQSSSWRISSLNNPPKYELHRVNYCPWCKKELPKCCVCLFHLSCWNPAYDPPVTFDKQYDMKHSSCTAEDSNNWFTWCLRCRHSSHVSHILQWFLSHPSMETYICPVSGCCCSCMEEEIV